MVTEGLVALWTLQSGVVKEGPRKGEVLKMEKQMGMDGAGGEKKEL